MQKLDTHSRELSPGAIEAKFFAAKLGLPLHVIEVMDALTKQNSKGGFIPSLAKQTGYAVWEKSQVKHLNKISTFNRDGENEDVVEVFTPIVQQDSNFVNGFFFSKIIGDSVELHLYRANDYDLYPYGNIDSSTTTAEAITFKLIELNEEVFGLTKFQVNDTNLFKKYYPAVADTFKRTIELKSNSTQPGVNSFAYSHTAVFCQVDLCPARNSKGNNNPDYSTVPGSNTCLYCYNVSIWVYDDFEWPEDPGVPTGSGGGGGGGGDTPPAASNCTPTTNCGQLRSLIIEGREPCGGCGPGPVIVVPLEEPPAFNPYNADTVIIGPSLANYPCVSRIIDSLTGYANMNALAQVALHTVFGVNQGIRLTFMADNGLPISEDGHTEPGNLIGLDSVYETTVHLNTWMLANSTQQYIAATIIHESIHSYIQFCYHEYLNGRMDSTRFKSLFPLYWPPKEISTSNFPYYYQMGNGAQHRAMAANLIGIMQQALTSLFPNNSISSSVRDSIYEAITWGGLDETPSFAARSDSMYIRAMNSMPKDTSIHAPFILNGFPNTFYHQDAHNSNLVKGCQ